MRRPLDERRKASRPATIAPAAISSEAAPHARGTARRPDSAGAGAQRDAQDQQQHQRARRRAARRAQQLVAAVPTTKTGQALGSDVRPSGSRPVAGRAAASIRQAASGARAARTKNSRTAAGQRRAIAPAIEHRRALDRCLDGRAIPGIALPAATGELTAACARRPTRQQRRAARNRPARRTRAAPSRRTAARGHAVLRPSDDLADRQADAERRRRWPEVTMRSPSWTPDAVRQVRQAAAGPSCRRPGSRGRACARSAPAGAS